MKFARVGQQGSERGIIGIGDVWFEAGHLTGDLGPDFWAQPRPSDREVAELSPADIQGQRWGCPITKPPAIVCIGQNYAAHAAESGSQPPQDPVVFFKVDSCLSGPDDDVAYPAEYTTVDWEVELGVILGREAWMLKSADEAMACVAGYVLANDLSERTLQRDRSGGQWSKGKCLPGFAPVGPWVVSADEFDPTNADLRSFVNGEPRQDSNTRDMIFGVAELIMDLSRCMKLEPGTLLLTGTPQGVAMSGKFPYLTDGDVVSAEIPGLGSQKFTMRAQQF